jgi:hypothetical protein
MKSSIMMDLILNLEPPTMEDQGWNELQDNHKEAEWKMTKSLSK